MESDRGIIDVPSLEQFGVLFLSYLIVVVKINCLVYVQVESKVLLID